LQALDATPFTYVDTLAALRGVAQRLAGAREVAVDLEHHSFRSYQVISSAFSDAHHAFRFFQVSCSCASSYQILSSRCSHPPAICRPSVARLIHALSAACRVTGLKALGD